VNSCRQSQLQMREWYQEVAPIDFAWDLIDRDRLKIGELCIISRMQFESHLLGFPSCLCVGSLVEVQAGLPVPWQLQL
jgi:hypothetical protein